jgi:hypothetical protein
MDRIVFLAQLLDFGIQIIVFALKIESGMVKIAFAHQDFSDLNVFHAQHQDSGIMLKANAFVLKTEYGTDKIAFAHQDFSDLNVFHAQLQDHGITL